MSDRKLPYRYKSDYQTQPVDVQALINSETTKLRNEFTDILKKNNEIKDAEITKERGEKTNLAKMLEEIKKKQTDNSVFCPTCAMIDNDGHEHKHVMKELEGGIFQCTGPECKSRKIMVDLNSDYECDTCHLPVKMPKDKKMAQKMTCPWCGNPGRMNFKDWDSKLETLRKKVKK